MPVAVAEARLALYLRSHEHVLWPGGTDACEGGLGLGLGLTRRAVVLPLTVHQLARGQLELRAKVAVLLRRRVTGHRGGEVVVVDVAADVRDAPPNPNPGTEPPHVLLMKAWPPLSQDLGKMFTLDRFAKEYNELIVDGDHWTRHLPGIIEAFVIAPEREGGVVELQKTRERFLRAYGLDETAAPVVRFDGAGGRTPFVLA